ncbi:hypothetical protein CsSME_00008312 [Camellia sinensis var. sinensis]
MLPPPSLKSPPTLPQITAVENTVEMDINNNSKFQLHHQHQPPKQHNYCSMSLTFRYHI